MSMNVPSSFIFSLTVVTLALGMAAGCARHTAPSTLFAAAQAKLAQADIGKDLFVTRCGSCHSENGAKPLRVGLPLSERKLSREVITKAVQGRLKDKSQAEQQAVVQYIVSFQAKR